MRFTVLGKPVYDPRTGLTAYSGNAALVCADWASDPVCGLGLQVNQVQLIAAANICDEQVALAAGGTDPPHIHRAVLLDDPVTDWSSAAGERTIRRPEF